MEYDNNFLRWILILRNRTFLGLSKLKNYMLVKYRKKDKVFAIGFNKTGTTSLEKALKEFDYITGHQRDGEKLLDDLLMDNYESLFKHCQKGEAFQDFPFSTPNIYKKLDKWFPNSKFILTIRDDDEQWFNSISNFHSKLWGNGKIPTEIDLKNADYIYKGYPYKFINYIFGPNLYNKELYKSIYNKHNNNVINYFKNRPNQLIIINVATKADYKRLYEFLDKTPTRSSFSWENKT